MDRLPACELREIESVKERLLPQLLHRPPGWEVAGCHEDGTRPGGDFYDLYPLPHGRTNLFLADAGEGGVAALVAMGMLRVLLDCCPLSCGHAREPYCPLSAPVPQPPHLLLGHLNCVLAKSLPMEQCLVAFCAILEPDSGQIQYASAGYPAPLWWRADGQYIDPVREVPGLPLGMNAEATYHRRWLEAGPGDVLLFFSDALVCAQDPRGRAFGLRRLERILHKQSGNGAAAVRDAVVERLYKHLGGALPTDDMTILVLTREPRAS
jgi:sigma-B regulation protein RsbU (phosphoserine phosphatase)